MCKYIRFDLFLLTRQQISENWFSLNILCTNYDAVHERIYAWAGLAEDTLNAISKLHREDGKLTSEIRFVVTNMILQ